MVPEKKSYAANNNHKSSRIQKQYFLRWHLQKNFQENLEVIGNQYLGVAFYCINENDQNSVEFAKWKFSQRRLSGDMVDTKLSTQFGMADLDSFKEMTFLG